LAIAWNEDDPRDTALLVRNLSQVLRQVAEQASLRHLPTVEMAQEWHRRVYAGARLPVPYYAGEIRDSDPELPELYGYEVSVGSQRGVESAFVPAELSGFEAEMREMVAPLDTAIPVGDSPGDVAQLRSALTLCAYAHGEWVRIHPFANGNGRIARIWSNWCALRYGLPPFVRLKPRPQGTLYATAAALSMRGDHQAMVAVLVGMLDRHLAGTGEPAAAG
jgi:fido (protein-threonine AMPylation protein)